MIVIEFLINEDYYKDIEYSVLRRLRTQYTFVKEEYYEELLKEFRGCFYILLKKYSSEEAVGEHPSFSIYLLVTKEVMEEIVLNYRR
ncbi:hypothetical protein HF764_002733 [Listeria monocytogenes]|nr:hypothetical protein [Listeria monocytogenes]